MESFSLKEPENFVPGNNPSSYWVEWKKYFNFYMAASKIILKNDKRKIATLLKFMGNEGIEIFNTFEFPSVNGKIEYDEVVKKFDDVYGTILNTQRDKILENNLKTSGNDTKLSVMQERYIFNCIIQGEGEPFDSFFLRIKTRALTCQFEGSEDSLIRDRIILGVNSETLRKSILKKDDLNLNEVVKLCRSYEKIKLRFPPEKNDNEYYSEEYSRIVDHSKSTKKNVTDKKSLTRKKSLKENKISYKLDPIYSCEESDVGCDKKYSIKKLTPNIDYNAKYKKPPSDESDEECKSARENKSYPIINPSEKSAKILTDDDEFESGSDQKDSKSTKSIRRSPKILKHKRKNEAPVGKKKLCENNEELDSKLDKKLNSKPSKLFGSKSDSTLRIQKSKLEMMRSSKVRTKQSPVHNNKVYGPPELLARQSPKYHKSVDEIEIDNIQQRRKFSSKKSYSRRNISDSTKLRAVCSSDKCVDSSEKIVPQKLVAKSSKKLPEIKERENSRPETAKKSVNNVFQGTSLALYCSAVNCNSSDCYKLHVNDESEDCTGILIPNNAQPEYAQRMAREKILKNKSYFKKDVLLVKKTYKRSYYEKESLKKRKIFTNFKMDSEYILPPGYQLKPIRSEVVDLKKELKAKGLSSAGNKEELIERLKMNSSSTESSMSEIDALHDNIDSDLLDDEDGLEEELDEMEEEEVLKKTAEDELKSLQSALEKDGMTEPSFSSNLPPLEQRKSRKITLIRHSAIPTLEEEEEKKALEPLRDLDFKAEAPKTVAASTSEQVNGGQRKIIKLNCNLSNEERMKLRAQKFGMAAEEEKKQARAIRFGLSSNVTSSVSSTDALKARAERFGVKTEEDPERPKTEKELKMEARRIRFSSPEKSDEDKRKKIRAEKFKIQF